MCAWWARVRQKGPGQKRRHHHGNIGQVRAPEEGVVKNHRIPRRPGELAHHVAERVGHASEVHGNMGGLGEKSALGVEERAGVVEPILNIGRQRRAPKHDPHLFAKGASAVRQQRQRDSVHELSRLAPFYAPKRPLKPQKA